MTAFMKKWVNGFFNFERVTQIGISLFQIQGTFAELHLNVRGRRQMVE